MENKYSEVVCTIARKDGVSEEYVYLQLQQAINARYYNQDPAVQAYWKKIAPDGVVPSPEQLIEILIKKLKYMIKIYENLGRIKYVLYKMWNKDR